MTKTPTNPYTNRTFETNGQHKNATKNFNNTTIVDSWSNNSHPTGVVKPVYGYTTFPLIAKAVLLKGYRFKNSKPKTTHKQ